MRSRSRVCCRLLLQFSVQTEDNEPWSPNAVMRSKQVGIRHLCLPLFQLCSCSYSYQPEPKIRPS